MRPGASREELGELLATTFVGGTAAPTIRAGRSTAQSLQNDTEVIEGLKAGHLDRLHRLYRLSRRVPWTIPELDRTIGRLTAKGLSSGLGDTALLRIARLLEHQEQLGLSVEELCGLWSELPNDPVDGGPGLFDALFNPPQLASLGTPLAYASNPQGSFQHPSFNNAGTSLPQDDNTLARLLAGLRVSDEELVQLLLKLALPLGLSADKKLKLSIRNLTLLVPACHARPLPRVDRRRPLPALGGRRAYRPRRRPGRPPVPSGTGRSRARASSTISTRCSRRIAGRAKAASPPTRSPSSPAARSSTRRHSSPPRSAPTPQASSTRSSLNCSPTARSSSRTPCSAGCRTAAPRPSPKTSPAGSFRRTPRSSRHRLGRAGLRLKKEVAAADVTIPGPAAEFAVTKTEVAAELTKHSVNTLLGPSLAKALDFSVEKTTALLRLSGQDATLSSSGFRGSFTAVVYETSTDRSDLLTLAKALLPYAVLYRDELYDETTLDAIDQDAAVFAVDVSPLEPEAVRLATLFGRLASGPDPAYATSAPPADVAAVLAVANTGVTTATSDVLARALRTDAARIDALRPHLTATLPANRLDALAMMASCLELTGLLEISGETLRDLALTPGTGAEYGRLRRAADALFAAFRTKYESDAEFRKKIEPYEDTLRSRKRDGLVAFIRFRQPARFRLESDLYEYFLVDVEVEGCARTTRVAAAIFSLQLYVHRVLMHLERTETVDVGDRARIPRDEWEWRRHYRIWQANRRVFLYPENYLEPGLRDDKTPLFSELEDTLLQQQVTEQNVRDGYARYLTGFDELAGLEIAAACWQPGDAALESPDVLHLFGVTSSEPPVFYYRPIAGLEKAADTKSVQFDAVAQGRPPDLGEDVLGGRLSRHAVRLLGRDHHPAEDLAGQRLVDVHRRTGTSSR